MRLSDKCYHLHSIHHPLHTCNINDKTSILLKQNERSIVINFDVLLKDLMCYPMRNMIKAINLKEDHPKIFKNDINLLIKNVKLQGQGNNFHTMEQKTFCFGVIT